MTAAVSLLFEKAAGLPLGLWGESYFRNEGNDLRLFGSVRRLPLRIRFRSDNGAGAVCIRISVPPGRSTGRHCRGCGSPEGWRGSAIRTLGVPPTTVAMTNHAAHRLFFNTYEHSKPPQTTPNRTPSRCADGEDEAASCAQTRTLSRKIKGVRLSSDPFSVGSGGRI